MSQRFAGLSTPLLCDALVRLGEPLRLGPVGLDPVSAGMKMAGPVRPVRHYGSVDVFLEALDMASPGEVGGD